MPRVTEAFTRRAALLFISTLVAVPGCEKQESPVRASAGSSHVFISVVNDMDSNPQSVDMAMKFAGFALDEGRSVMMFFNVKGVRVPSKELADGAAFEGHDPIKQQLAALIDRGAVVHVCPICMKALGVEESQLVSGSQVTTRPSLFENIRADTTVFTY